MGYDLGNAHVHFCPEVDTQSCMDLYGVAPSRCAEMTSQKCLRSNSAYAFKAVNGSLIARAHDGVNTMRLFCEVCHGTYN